MPVPTAIGMAIAFFAYIAMDFSNFGRRPVPGLLTIEQLIA
jgi:hypothetical protein